MFNLFKPRSRSLKEALGRTKKIVIEGVIFEIRKLDPLDHLDGSKVMLGIYNTYQTQNINDIDPGSAKKVRSVFRDMIMSAVVKPVLSRKENDGDAVWIEDVLKDWDMSVQLVDAITEHTHGKKKM